MCINEKLAKYFEAEGDTCYTEAQRDELYNIFLEHQKENPNFKYNIIEEDLPDMTGSFVSVAWVCCEKLYHIMFEVVK